MYIYIILIIGCHLNKQGALQRPLFVSSIIKKTVKNLFLQTDFPVLPLLPYARKH